MLPWMVSTFGKPENTALNETFTLRALTMDDVGLDFAQLGPRRRMQP